MTRHKHADLIIEWAETGCPIQFRMNHCKWIDVKPGRNPDWSEKLEYRKKPQVIKYRRYIKRFEGPEYSISIIEMDDINPEKHVRSFYRWIDTEWQEVEI